MFTGIITDIGTIESITDRGDLHVRIATSWATDTIALGASIACSGVCLTVVGTGDNWFAVDVSGETVSRTATGMWTAGRRLNLERAMKVGDELGGHIVTGHVDGIGEVVDIAAQGGSHRFTISAPREIAPFLAAKGSITVDGVSLTVNAVRDHPEQSDFDLNIIPHTFSVTTLGALDVGQLVNLEIDVLARYLKRMETYRAQG
ncbi:riboflavin synthase [Stakelama tenebrarum]|uniref:Riboflavin synthase n=1 Tax=Stakelama tenebrarum TaxID=2711215 RepID=A0A6G6Y0M4_9SPHN|nr:riboflavin synthase [Sphingosinithalassobacter tenebrarum]QIG78494.1 riboflavin synthase [Sphingosinithalassobacter tenebrarum]